MSDIVPVVKPYLPDENKYKKYVSKIFKSGWLTNNGPFHKEFENKLQKFLGVKKVILVSNCTLGLQLAYNALNLSGNVITTPFSFVATSSSLVWENIKPNFCDIDKNTWNIDSKKIEQSINENTSGILGVHVYGNPCNVKDIEKIAIKNNLKVVYDAAHAFDTKIEGNSILKYGDVSILSFHATKVLHSIEGGAIILNDDDDDLEFRIRSMINFGQTEGGAISEVGINTKMNEFQAAMGLCLLDDFDKISEKRRSIYDYYMSSLNKKFNYQVWRDEVSNNYSYFPILFDSEKELMIALNNLNSKNIYPRRYFYPSLNLLSIYQNNTACPISEDISSRVLCLPIYPSLEEKDLKRICNILNKKTN